MRPAAWHCAKVKQKTCVRSILFKVKSFDEVPMTILELLEFLLKRGQLCIPILSS